METFVTASSTLRLSNRATLEQFARICKEISLLSDQKMRTTSYVTWYGARKQAKVGVRGLDFTKQMMVCFTGSMALY